MRLALIVVPSVAKASATARRVSLLADRLAERMAEPDAAFRVEVLEARGRLGERIASLLAEAGASGPTLVFASSDFTLDDDGPALALAGGSRLALSDLRATLAGQADHVLLVLDVKHAADPDDPTLSATLLDAAYAAIEPKESGISLLVGARPEDDDAPTTSPFARSFLAALDAARGKLSRSGSVSAEALYQLMKSDDDRFHEIPAAGWFRGRGEFPLLVQQSVVVANESGPPSRASGRPAATKSVRPSIPPGARTPAFEEAWQAGKDAAAKGKHDDAIEHLKRALLLLGQRPERAELYFRIGKAKAALGKGSEAVHNYDKALAIEPLHHDAFEHARKLLLESRDFTRIEGLYRRRLEARSDDEARLKEVSAIARLWLEEAKEPVKAIAALEHWVKLSEDKEGLALLVDALSQAGRHAGANDARKRLARLFEEDAPKRARVLVAAAQVAAKHLPGGGDCLDLAKAALDADPSVFEALEVASNQLGTRRRWRELAELYERVLAKTTDAVVGWDLGKKLGMLYRDELDDLEGALTAFSRAHERKPGDVELCLWLLELHQAKQSHEEATTVVRRSVSAAPDHVELYRRALWCFEKTGEADAAWNAACVLDHLGEADINESLLADTHRPDGLLNARGSFADEQWRALRPERDEALERLLEVVGPAAMQLRRSELALSDDTLQNPAGTTTLMRSLAWTARLLGVPVPAVHVLPTVEGELTPLPLEDSVVAASRSVASGLELPELAFLWARVLAYLRPEHRLITFYPTAPDVAKLLLGSLAVAGLEEAEGDAALVADKLLELVDADTKKDLKRAAKKLGKKKLRSRVARHVAGVHAAAGRAGLIACGDIARAAALVSRFPLGSGRTEAEQLAELFAFAISAEHCSIREHLGVAVRG